MKKQDLFKFSLTAMCVAVLSACGSSGGGSLAVENTPTTPSTNANANANTGAANSAELAAAQKAAQEAAAQKAAADKAAAEAAAKQAAAEKAAAAAKTAAEKAAAEKAAAEAKAAAEKAAAEKAAKEAAAKAAAEQAAAVKKAAEEAAKKAAEEAAKKAAIEQAAAVKKAAEEAAAKALKDKEAADKKAAEDQAKAAEEAAKKAAEEAAKKAANDATNPFGAKDQLTAAPDTARNTSFVGFKQTVKLNSNLATNTSEKKDSTSDVPTPMAVQHPHPSFDTIVVAEPRNDAGAARVYLEDFDTRFIKPVPGSIAPNNPDGDIKPHGINKVPNKPDQGNRILTNLYINQNTNGKSAIISPEIEAERKALNEALEAVTKLETAAKQAFDKVDGELSALQTKIKDFENPSLNPSWDSGDSLLIGAAKVELNRMYDKLSVLTGQKAEAEKKLHTAQAEKIKARTNLNLFAGEYPAPTNVPGVSQGRTLPTQGAGYETKTETMGVKEGTIWVFGAEDIYTRHQNFTERSDKIGNPNYQVKNGFIYQGKDVNGNLIVKGFGVKDVVYEDAVKAGESVNSRHLDGTVAEVYGHRSGARTLNGFEPIVDLQDWSNARTDKNGQVDAVAANNLPLVNDYYGAKLYNVQYGRVTSALHNQAATTDYLKEGRLLDGTTPTLVASFGQYGQDGTENHYFYRGINNVGAEELTKLKEDPKNGIITYEGHAVAYGLNNNYRGNVGIPTAIGAKAGFVSGNHATLAVNLGNGEVTGNIHNKWYDSVQSPDKLLPVNLVTFKGLIADNGNIAGTATREDNKTTGVFGATLFDNGKEVGGSFASDKHGKDEQWGGVFGGIRTPATPEAIKEAGMAVATDKKN